MPVIYDNPEKPKEQKNTTQEPQNKLPGKILATVVVICLSSIFLALTATLIRWLWNITS